MMGVDDMLLSFGISYLAGNIKEWLSKDKNVQEQIDDCLDKALKQWSVNRGIRDIERDRRNNHLEELRQMLSIGEVKDPSYAELIKLWLEEMRKNDICYNFILEHKLDLATIKVDSGFANLADLVRNTADTTHEKIDNVTAMMQQMMADMHVMRQELSTGTADGITKKLKELLSGSVNGMISHLFMNSAKRMLEQMEQLFAEEIGKDKELEAQISLQKGIACSYDHTDECYGLYHKAYLLMPSDNTAIEKEIAVRLHQGDEDGAVNLAGSLLENSIKKTAIQVAFAQNPEQAYSELTEGQKKNYALRYTIFSLLANKQIDVAFLFGDELVTAPDTLTCKNLLDWIYVVTYYNVKTGNYIIISPDYQVPAIFYNAYHATNKLYELMLRTEIGDRFPMLKAQVCYWGFIVDQNPSRITLIHEIDEKSVGTQRPMLIMMQASMHAIAKEYDEAISLLATNAGPMNSDLINMVLLISYHTQTLMYMDWLIGLVKEQNYKLDSLSAKLLAFNVNIDTAQKIGGLIEDSMFANTPDAVVLMQLCKYYGGEEVNVEVVREAAKKVTDEVLPYAAFILANRDEAKAALELLSPKVNGKIRNMMQRVYIEALSKIPEETPTLYHLLVENRKSGVPCDDTILYNEFTLDVKVADFQNAFEAMSLLYERHPDDEAIFVNYLWLLGRFKPEELDKLRDKAMKFEYSSGEGIVSTYRVYSDNDYIEFAAEFLYYHVRLSDDWSLKNAYMAEATMGKLHGVVHPQFEKVDEGMFVVCQLPDDQRVTYQAKKGNVIGELLIGRKENESLICEIAGEDVELKLIHILNKYGKLSLDITKEIMTGDNPNARPFKVDMKKPVESLNACMEKFNPGTSHYMQDKMDEQSKYEKGEIGLVNIVGRENILADYYSRLVGSSQVYVMPSQQCELLFMRGRTLEGTRYVLDFSAVIMLYEFQQQSGCTYSDRFIVSTTLYEYVVASSKNVLRMLTGSIQEVYKNASLKRYDRYIDKDFEERLEVLVKWMRDNCEVIVPEKSLAIPDRNISNELNRIMTDTVSLVLGENRMLVSDDKILVLLTNYQMPVISTETYMQFRSDEDGNTKYRQMLMDSNYMGIYIPSEMIVDEYRKIEAGAENRLTYIMQNTTYNTYMATEVVKGCVGIAGIANDEKRANMTITNMMVMMIKSLDVKVRSSIVSSTLAYLSFNFPNFGSVKRCLQDAAKICNVIILPPTLM